MFEEFDRFLPKKPRREIPVDAEFITWHEWRLRSLEPDGSMGKKYFQECRQAYNERIQRESVKPEPVVVPRGRRKKEPVEGPSLVGLE